MKNYYDILEISPQATRDEIKSAFRAKARKYHPDVNHTLEAEILFKQVNLAAKTLLDDAMRSQYDFAYGFNQKKKEYKTKETYSSFEKKEEKKTYEDFTSSFYAYFKNKCAEPKPGLLLGTRLYNNKIPYFKEGEEYKVTVHEIFTDNQIAVFDCLISDKSGEEIASATVNTYQGDNIEELLESGE